MYVFYYEIVRLSPICVEISLILCDEDESTGRCRIKFICQFVGEIQKEYRLFEYDVSGMESGWEIECRKVGRTILTRY